MPIVTEETDRWPMFAVEVHGQEELKKTLEIFEKVFKQEHKDYRNYPAKSTYILVANWCGNGTIGWGEGSFSEHRSFNIGPRLSFSDLINRIKGETKKGKEVKKIMKDIAEIKFKREEDRQVLYIKVLDWDVADLFKSEDKERSEHYTDTDGEGLEFYALKDKLSILSKKFNNSYSVGRPMSLRKYGSDLVSEEDGQRRFNLSLLRSCAIKKGVSVNLDGLILKEDVTAWSESLASFLKFVYQEFVLEKDREIRATVTFEY